MKVYVIIREFQTDRKVIGIFDKLISAKLVMCILQETISDKLELFSKKAKRLISKSNSNQPIFKLGYSLKEVNVDDLKNQENLDYDTLYTVMYLEKSENGILTKSEY